MIKNFLKKIITSQFIKKRLNNINNFINNPIETQKKTMLNLIKTASNTLYGKKYNFRYIKNYKDYSDRVPINKYEDLIPFIKKICNGDLNILWPGPVKWIAKSSGTSFHKSKFIPITKECLYKCHYKGGKDLIAIYLNNHQNTNILNGKNLRLGGSYKTNKNGIIYGDISSILIKKLPLWVEYYSFPRKKTVLINKWDLKINNIINNIANKNIISITGVPSWMLILLNKILKNSKKKYISDIWNNIEVFFHGGVHFDPYIKQYENIINKNIKYYNVYNASEGFFAIQDKKKSKDLLLLLDHGIFYEFIPLNEINNEHPSIIPIEKVELNKNYAMVISTNTGLWRYILGDTVKFTSTFPYRIIISGRTKNFINVFGEEIIIDNVEKAISNTCKSTNAIVCEYTVGPIYINKKTSGAHEWIIEFKKPPINILLFRNILDEELKSLNSDYEAKRFKNMTLLPPVIKIARKNLFYDWFKLYNKLGGQNKIPRLCNNRKYIDVLTNMNL